MLRYFLDLFGYDKFTEKQLPKGSMMLVGRSLGGSEVATMINPTKDTSEIIKVMDQCLNDWPVQQTQ